MHGDMPSPFAWAKGDGRPSARLPVMLLRQHRYPPATDRARPVNPPRMTVSEIKTAIRAVHYDDRR